MSPRIVGATGNPALVAATARALGVREEERVLERFPDGELHVVLGRAQRGEHVFVVQPTGPPADEHLWELVLLVDACRRSGAARVTAVIPYFGYARQDRRDHAGEAIGARAAADVIRSTGVDDVVVVDPHSAALETMFGIPFESLTAVPLIAAAVRPLVTGSAVVVAPDLGAVKLAERYAAALELPVVIVRKVRVSGEAVRAIDVVGDVRDRQPLVVDDMITTAGTVEAAVRALLERGALPDVVVAATHGVFVEPAPGRLDELPIGHIVVSDTLAATAVPGLPVSIVGIHELLAATIDKLYDGGTRAG